MKPIYLTPEDKAEMMNEFQQQLSKTSLFNGEFNFTRKYYFDPKTAGPKARILYTPLAYVKMLKLIQEFASEIAWHGLVMRGEDEADFIVYDIITHEQTVTGSTVTTDDEQFRKFYEGLTDEQAEHLFMQAHSHVNFSTTPSAVDLDHQAKIVQQMAGRKNKGFQIFQIWNKSLKHNSYIYDFANNVFYEDKDIIVDILLDGANDYLATNFVMDAKRIVTIKTTTPAKTQTTTKKSAPAEGEGSAAKKAQPLAQNQRGYTPWWEREDVSDVDFDQEFFQRQGAAYGGYNGYNGYDYGYN